MKSLTRAVKHSTHEGAAIPTPWATFTDHRLLIRRQEVTLIAADPGEGKTTMMLSLATHPNVHTLYLCADTSWRAVAVRLATMLANNPATNRSGRPEAWITRDMEAAFDTDPDWVGSILAAAPQCSFAFPQAPTSADVATLLDGYFDVHGHYPDLLVVDNLMDLEGDADDDYASMRHGMTDLKNVARDFNTAAVVLHHTNEQAKPREHPPARGEVTGKVSQKASLVLTLRQDRFRHEMQVAPVKNRDEACDPTGRSYVPLALDLARMAITDPAPRF